MKKNLFVAAIAAATVMSSCSQNDIMQDMTENNAMTFSPYAGKSTKGSETTTTSMQTSGFGLFAFNTGTTPWGSAIAPNVMYNQEVMYDKDNNAWTYAPLKYWKLKDNYSFFAYAPYGDASNGIAINSANDYLRNGRG